MIKTLNIILNELPDIRDSFSRSFRIEVKGKPLFSIRYSQITTPYLTNTLDIFKYKTKLKEESLSSDVILRILSDIKATKKYKRLNHIGFCYKVRSKVDEVKKLVNVVTKTEFSVYQEPSSDESDWIFIGDRTEISSPMIEFLPNEGNSDDKWIDYWLPHIHVDIDTDLSPDQIRSLVKKHITDPHIPHSIIIDGICYTQRVRIGCLDGVNLFIDISTNNRDLNYRSTWKKLQSR